MSEWDDYEFDSLREAVSFIKAYEVDLTKAEALAAEMKGELDKLTQELYDSKYIAVSRKELLRRCKSVIDVCGVDWKHSTSRLDPALFDELAEELGDG